MMNSSSLSQHSVCGSLPFYRRAHVGFRASSAGFRARRAASRPCAAPPGPRARLTAQVADTIAESGSQNVIVVIEAEHASCAARLKPAPP